MSLAPGEPPARPAGTPPWAGSRLHLAPLPAADLVLPEPPAWPAPVRAAHRATAAWAAARRAALLDRVSPGLDRWGAPLVPVYGEPAFARLPAADPRREVAVLLAAERWREEAEQAPARLQELLRQDAQFAAALRAHWDQEQAEDWRRLAGQVRGLAKIPTYAELQERRERYPPHHEVRASPGWTPVAVPGRPGWWRHCLADGQQVDLPTPIPPDPA